MKTHAHAHTHSHINALLALQPFHEKLGTFTFLSLLNTVHYCLFCRCPMEIFPGTCVQVDHVLAMTSTTVATVDLSRKDKVQNVSDHRTQSLYCPGFLVFLLEVFEWVFSSLFEGGLIGNCSPNPLGPFRKTHWK